MNVAKFVALLRRINEIEIHDSSQESLIINMLRMLYNSFNTYDTNRTMVILTILWSNLPDTFESILIRAKIVSNDLISTISNGNEVRQRVMLRRLLGQLESRELIMGDSDKIICTLILITALIGPVTLYRDILKNTLANCVSNQLILNKSQPYDKLIIMIRSINNTIDNDTELLSVIKEMIVLVSVMILITHLRKRSVLERSVSSMIFDDNRSINTEMTNLLNIAI